MTNVQPANAARLSIELLCHGLRLGDGLRADAEGRGIQRTRAGLGSGIELCIPGRRKLHWVNVAVEEAFARRSPWVLSRRDTGDDPDDDGLGHAVVDTRSGFEWPVYLPPEPAWYRRETSRGIAMSDVGVLQGTYLGVYVGDVCAFWAGRGSDACGFCTTGVNVGEHESLEKSVADVVETARAAKAESGVTFVHLNAGYAGPRTLEVVDPYARALKEEVGVLVGVQATPTLDFARYDRLRDIGVDHLSFCYEFHDPDVLAEHCPGKSRAIGHETYLKALEHCSRLFGRGSCSGEIIAGVEPIESTLKAIDWIASVGAFPTVCVFRPLAGSRMEQLPPPDPKDMETVYREVWNACRRHLVPVGMAPGIDVSLVLTPDDTADLFDRSSVPDRVWRAALAVGRLAARAGFRRRMRTGRRPAPEAIA